MSKKLVLSCNVLLSEEGFHPDGIFIDQGEEVEAYYQLPSLDDLLRDTFGAKVVDELNYDRICGLRITIEQNVNL